MVNLPPNYDINGEPLSVVVALGIILSVDNVIPTVVSISNTLKFSLLIEIRGLTVQGPQSLSQFQSMFCIMLAQHRLFRYAIFA